MGNDPPKTENPKQELVEEDKEDIYIMEDLSNFTLKGKREQTYFWIDPKIFNSENQKYESFLRKHIQIEGCSTVDFLEREIEDLDTYKKIKVICAASLKDEDYKRLDENDRIPVIYLFCQNEERAKLLMSNFPKIKSVKFDIVELKDHLLQEENSDQGIDPKTNLLLMIEEDTNLMNKYRIVFHSLTSGNSKSKAKADYLNFVKKFYPDSLEEINEFDKMYKVNLSGKEALSQAAEWLIKPGFFWESIQTLPKITTDPKKLAYLRFPFKESYEAIFNLHKSNPTPVAETFMVITPSSEELEKILCNFDNFLFFTSFIKAFTKEKEARRELKKNNKSILVRIMVGVLGKIDKNLDFGYRIFSDVKEGAPDVIFNIYNVFKIIEYEEESREMTIQYGSLAEVAVIREKERNVRLKPYEENLLRNYDYLQDVTSRISSQATILQMSGYFQDSLLIYNQKLEMIRRSQPSQEILDKHKIELGDAYRINEEFDKAEEQFLSIKEGKMLLIAHVHLAELYFTNKSAEKLERIVSEIEKNLGKYKNISEPDSFKAQNYIGMELINRGKFKEASKLYKSLSREINDYYEYKFEGIPLVHEINRNRAACETKLSNYTEALNLLDSTKGWQKICEGNKSPGLIITENLIRSVHASRGESEEAIECEKQILKIRKAATLQDNIYLSRSGVFINLEESKINIAATSSSNDGVVPALKIVPTQQLLDQSSINIEL